MALSDTYNDVGGSVFPKRLIQDPSAAKALLYT